MREVNKAYKLPNPPTWYQTLFKSTIAAIVKLAKKITYYKREPVRVSWTNIKPAHIIRLDDCT